MVGFIVSFVFFGLLSGVAADPTQDDSPVLENWKSYRQKRLASEMNLINREYAALKRLLKKADSDPYLLWGWARACELAMQLGRWTEASGFAERILETETDPGLKTRAQRWQARSLLGSGRKTREAIAAYQAIATQEPALAASPLLELHDFLVAQGKLEPVEKVLSLLNSLRPELSPYVDEIRAQLRRIGGAAPKFDGELFDGTTLKGESTLGKVTIIHFWSLENRESLEALHRFSDLARSEKQELVSFNLEGSSMRTMAKTYLEATEVFGSHQGCEGGFAGEVALKFQVESLPTTWVLDQQGKVAGINLNLDATEQLVKRLITKKDSK